MSPHRSIIAIAAIAMLVVGCGGQTAALSSNQPSEVAEATPATETPVDSATPEPTAEPTEVPTEAPTPEPVADGPAQYKAGQTITVTQNDDPYLDIVVSQVSQKSRYGTGYFVDRPKKGNVYLQALVSYKALADGATYNQFDWQVFCNDEAIDEFSFVSNGPDPSLSSGTLPQGRKAKGWVVYELPKTGRCVMSYGANSFINEGAVFEVVVRAK